MRAGSSSEMLGRDGVKLPSIAESLCSLVIGKPESGVMSNFNNY